MGAAHGLDQEHPVIRRAVVLAETHQVTVVITGLLLFAFTGWAL